MPYRAKLVSTGKINAQKIDWTSTFSCCCIFFHRTIIFLPISKFAAYLAWALSSSSLKSFPILESGKCWHQRVASREDYEGYSPLRENLGI